MAEFGCVGKIAALVTANHLFICFCRQYIVVVGPLAQQIVAIIIQMVGQETWWVGKDVWFVGKNVQVVGNWDEGWLSFQLVGKFYG